MIFYIDLSEEEAYALANLCKRMTWEDFHKLSYDQAEHDAMDTGTSKLRAALAEAGVDPR